MARKRYSIDEKTIARFVKEGRGQGVGASYKPWLRIDDVPSDGRSHRISGWKTRRIHHLLSDIERDVFYVFDWSDTVTDIREQFPLAREVTQRIADEIGVMHPLDTVSRTPLVMTTDFVIDLVRDGRIVTLARAVKPADQLNKTRTLEKLEIERRYWAEKGVDWGIVTKRDIPNDFVRNIEWVHGHRAFDLLQQPRPDYFDEKAILVRRQLEAAPPVRSLRQFCDGEDIRLAMQAGTSLMLVRHLLATKSIIWDMTVPLHDAVPVGGFRAGPGSTSTVRAAG